MNDFLATLNKVHSNGVTPKQFQPTKIQPESQEPLKIDIDLVLDRNRIDVRFNRNPGEAICSTLKAAGFRFKAHMNKAWIHKDTDENRRFLNREFNADLEMKDSPKPALQLMPAPEPAAPVQPSTQDTAFEHYKWQVDQLMDHFKVSAADLQLLAIDVLYRETFN